MGGPGLAFETWATHLMQVCSFFASNPAKSGNANRRLRVRLALNPGGYNGRDHDPGPRHKAKRV